MATAALRAPIALLSACIAVTAGLLLPAHHVFAQPAGAAAGSARIHIFRRDDHPVGESVAVGVDASRIGELANGMHVVVTVAPGPHTVRAGDRAMATLPVNAQANRTYYVWLQAMPGVRPLATDLALVNEATARPLLAVSAPLAVEIAPVPSATEPVSAPPGAPPSAAASQPAEPARATPAAKRGAIALLLGGGTFALDEPRQQVTGASYLFEEDSDGAFAGELEYRHPSGVAIGGELLYYQHKVGIPATSFRGDQDVVAFLLNAKYYLGIANVVYPFVGAGIGSAANSFGGDFSGNGYGFAAQALAGIELRFKNVGLYAQYKKLSATVKDADGEKLDVGGDGIIAGLSLSFGL